MIVFVFGSSMFKSIFKAFMALGNRMFCVSIVKETNLTGNTSFLLCDACRDCGCRRGSIAQTNKVVAQAQVKASFAHLAMMNAISGNAKAHLREPEKYERMTDVNSIANEAVNFRGKLRKTNLKDCPTSTSSPKAGGHYRGILRKSGFGLWNSGTGKKTTYLFVIIYFI